jgi:hypothetical protein
VPDLSDPLLERLALAQRHVSIGRNIVNQQRTLVEQMQMKRCDTSRSESLLEQFERSLEIFEHDLLAIQQEIQRHRTSAAAGFEVGQIKR